MPPLETTLLTAVTNAAANLIGRIFGNKHEKAVKAADEAKAEKAAIFQAALERQPRNESQRKIIAYMKKYPKVKKFSVMLADNYLAVLQVWDEFDEQNRRVEFETEQLDHNSAEMDLEFLQEQDYITITGYEGDSVIFARKYQSQ